MVHIAALTSATTISTQSSSTAEKGCSVLSIACDMPGSLVMYYNIILKELFFNFNYYYNVSFLFTSCRNCSWYSNKAGNAVLTPLGTRTCWKT